MLLFFILVILFLFMWVLLTVIGLVCFQIDVMVMFRFFHPIFIFIQEFCYDNI